MSYQTTVRSYIIGVTTLVFSCNIYDKDLIETDKDSLVGDSENLGGEAGVELPSGAGISTNGTGSTSTSTSSGSGASSGSDEFGYEQIDGSIAEDAAVGNVCGDTRVTGSEKCDIGIGAGNTGACPSDCPEPDECVQWRLVGTACQAECQQITPDCISGDDCCPAECTNATDSDCSASCGDGVVQKDAGETCEPRSALESDPNADALACPTQCEDDGDPCTTDMLTGSEENCNVKCVHIGITSIAEGDGCCPQGASANTDSDCAPICGNNIREGDEECDGSDICDDQCKTTMTPEQRACMEVVSIEEDECKACTCNNCTSQALLCLNSGNEALDEQCSAVVKCGNRTGCIGGYCYCRTAMDLTGNCPYGIPDGPCKTEIEQAAGTTNRAIIFFQQTDWNTAVGRATNFGNCHTLNCYNICYPDI